MVFDRELAERIRVLIASERDVEERAMFGGRAFLVADHMAVAASGQGGLLVRVDPDESDALEEKGSVEVMVMRRRAMKGWLRVSEDVLQTRKQLETWVKRGIEYARSLPAKAPKKKEKKAKKR